MNDSSHELSSNPRLFADDTSLFLVVQNTNLSANALNNGLLKVNNSACQWKMSFNPDASKKKTQEVIFSRKIKKPSHPVLIFNNNQVIQSPYQTFGDHLRCIANNISIGSLSKLQKCLPRRSLVTIYKSFIRSHLDYGDATFDQTYNKSFHESLESLQ